VKDVVSAIQFIAQNASTKTFPSVMNVGGENISLGEYCSRVKSTISSAEIRGEVELANNQEVVSSSMVNSSVFKSFGWEPKHTANDLIEEFIANLKQ